ncbi:MAG TPA: FkbM family methyltransferase [Vitreimonas sp.]|uniref:FkbM family methyltransferase n=1 Tax=Vitreimonas sp. TaxID=3069702 RepID=UPI002D668AEF|nr:FkbM family methyltransferase [Vitreimonas sp.]HYD87393.1 FkbM family methyltransferase [Vitreimonas sp.]
MHAFHSLLREVGCRTAFIGRRGRLFEALAPHQRLGPTPFEVDFYGKRYAGDLSNWIDWHVYFMGAYAPAELAFMKRAAAALRQARGSVNYYDVGANVGHHVLFMAGHADAVFAFEPFTRAAAELRRKMEMNDLVNVRLFELALGRDNGVAEMVLPDSHNLGAATLRAVPGVAAFFVNVARGDDLFARERLPRIDILKIDVEGHEAAVLDGLAEQVRRDRPVILVELTEEDRSGFGTAERLRAALYPNHVLHTLQPRGGGYRLAPFDMQSWEVVCVPAELAPIV